MVGVGIIGCGQWGPNHIRIFSQLSRSKALICSDLDQKRLDAIKEAYPDIKTTLDYKDILRDPGVDAVCIATPTKTHFAIAKEALVAGKHVLCEKPLSLDPGECDELKKIADAAGRILIVGHIFLFNAGINWLKEYLRSGELGDIHYAYATRTNLGPFRYDVNALWDLAPHDISIFNYLFDSCPVNVSARGHKCLGTTLEDIAFASLEYPGNIMANIHVSWVDPKKVRQITIVGDKKMVVWDDLDNVGPIKLYDKHVEKASAFYQTYGEFQLLSKEGSITIPKVGFSEPLKTQGQFFIDCIEKKVSPEIADATKGGDVVKVLCALQESIGKKGVSIEMDHS